jgi:glutamate formiminotransferase
MPPNKPLLAVPNMSEGRELATVQAIAQAFAADGMARLMNVHSDPDHHRSVFTLAGLQGELSRALCAGVCAAVERIDVGEGRERADIGEHPHVGAVDVVPVVYLDASQRGAACAEALVVAHEIGEGLGVPVLLYGELAQGRSRAGLRRGGVVGLGERLNAGELTPDFGSARLHPTGGATLVAAREPLVAFNLELAAPATIEDARRIASLIREGGGEGLPGVRAIGVSLRDRGQGVGGRAEGCDIEHACDPEMGRVGEQHDEQLVERAVEQRLEPGGGADGGPGDKEVAELRKGAPHARAGGTPLRDTVAQVSMNVERPLDVPLSAIVEAVRRHADVACAELVGLVPRAALEGFPKDVALVGFDPGAHVIENALGF